MKRLSKIAPVIASIVFWIFPVGTAQATPGFGQFYIRCQRSHANATNPIEKQTSTELYEFFGNDATIYNPGTFTSTYAQLHWNDGASATVIGGTATFTANNAVTGLIYVGEETQGYGFATLTGLDTQGTVSAISPQSTRKFQETTTSGNGTDTGNMQVSTSCIDLDANGVYLDRAAYFLPAMYKRGTDGNWSELLPNSFPTTFWAAYNGDGHCGEPRGPDCAGGNTKFNVDCQDSGNRWCDGKPALVPGLQMIAGDDSWTPNNCGAVACGPGGYQSHSVAYFDCQNHPQARFDEPVNCQSYYGDTSKLEMQLVFPQCYDESGTATWAGTYPLDSTGHVAYPDSTSDCTTFDGNGRSWHLVTQLAIRDQFPASDVYDANPLCGSDSTRADWCGSAALAGTPRLALSSDGTISGGAFTTLCSGPSSNTSGTGGTCGGTASGDFINAWDQGNGVALDKLVGRCDNPGGVQDRCGAEPVP